MNNKVVFEFSNTDIATYLIIKGHTISEIIVRYDKKHNNRIKAIMKFYGEKEYFIDIQRKYNSGNLQVCPKSFSIAKKKLCKDINIEISKFKYKELSEE